MGLEYYEIMESPYSQKQIAYFIGLSQQRLCDFKKGRGGISKKTAIRVSGLTGIQIHELFNMNYEEFMSAIMKAMEEAEF